MEDLQESFRGDFRGRTRKALEAVLKADSEQQMGEYLGLKWYERAWEGEVRIDSGNGSYFRDYVTPLGVIRVEVKRMQYVLNCPSRETVIVRPVARK